MKPTKAETPPPEPTISLPAPTRGMAYILVPDDIQHTVTLSGVASLCRLEHGDLIRDMSERLADLVSQSMARGKKSSLSLVIAIKPEGTKRIGITAKVDAKPPKQEAIETTLFATVQGQLLVNDPEQLSLDLKVVPLQEPAGGARKVISD